MKILLLSLLLLPINADAFWARAVRFSGTAAAFSPFDIVGSTVTNWYKADAGLNTSEPGATITTWADSSGSAYSSTLNSTAGTIKVSSITQNGISMVYCDGSSQMGGSNKTDVAQPHTWFLVFRPTAWTSAGTYQFIVQMEADVQQLRKRGTLLTVEFYAGTAIDGGTINNNTTTMLTTIFNGASSSLAINGGAPTTGNAGTNGSTSYPVICAASAGLYRYTGFIMEWLVYSGALSAADQTTVRNHLNSKWAIY